MKIRYILLLRHGAVDHTSDEPERKHPLKIIGEDKRGDDILSVAKVLAEHLMLLPKNENIRISEIWYGSYEHTKQTAKIIYETLKKRKISPKVFKECRALDPDKFRPLTKTEDRQKVGKWLLDNTMEKGCIGDNSLETDTTTPNSAILVVGHAPQIGWIAERILHDPFPIDRSELVCITIRHTWWERNFGDYRWLKWIRRDRWVSWTIWETSPQKAIKHQKDLYEKIDAKMKLAGILGSLITGILVFLLKSILDKDFPKLDQISQTGVFISVVFFFIALGLYLATMYAYDRLMMPIRFWAERAERKERKWLVVRPPSSSVWVLYQNMVRIWNRLFTPATWAVIVGLLVLAIVVFQPNIIVALLLSIFLIIFIVYYRKIRPTLGTDD